jgi:hypothetical protein
MLCTSENCADILGELRGQRGWRERYALAAPTAKSQGFAFSTSTVFKVGNVARSCASMTSIKLRTVLGPTGQD